MAGSGSIARARGAIAMVTATILGVAGMASAPVAASASEDPGPVPRDLWVVDTAEGDYVVDELSALDGTPISTVTTPITATASRATAPDGPSAVKGSGKGGSSTGSGCRKVTISNRATTYTGKTAYRYNTWTRWCWTRSTQRIHAGGSNGFFVSEADAFQYWRGQVASNRYFYDAGANDGHPRSAFYHYRQGRFENCVLTYGCVQTTYPTNVIRSYANGTYAWSTSGVS